MAARIRQAAAGADADRGQIAAVLDAARAAVSDALWTYARRVIYQCPSCGRLHVDGGSADGGTFVPTAAEPSATLLGSIAGGRWRRSVHAEWDPASEYARRYGLLPGRLTQGDWAVLPEVGLTQAEERFATWEELEARYHAVVEQARAGGTLRAALLRKDHEIVHVWPPDDGSAMGATPPWAIGIETLEGRDEGEPADDPIAVEVALSDGTRWTASFVAYASIASLSEEHRQSGAYLHGRYFWSRAMILVDEPTRQRIEEVVADLLQAGAFELAFRRA